MLVLLFGAETLSWIVPINIVSNEFALLELLHFFIFFIFLDPIQTFNGRSPTKIYRQKTFQKLLYEARKLQRNAKKNYKKLSLRSTNENPNFSYQS